MKRLLPIILSLLLCHCGTEVGNGVAPSGDTGKATSGSGTTNDNAGAPQAPDEADPTSGSVVYVPSTSFVAACASPFAESIEGTFADSKGTPGFTVTPTKDGKKAVSKVSGTLVYLVTPAPNVSPYAIESLPVAPNVSCGAVTSQTLSDGRVQRDVTLSSGAVVSWTLSGGKVISMTLTQTNVIQETWTLVTK